MSETQSAPVDDGMKAEERLVEALFSTEAKRTHIRSFVRYRFPDAATP